MMLRILVLLVTISLVKVSAADSSCVCEVSGDPVLESFTGTRLLILKEQTTLLTRHPSAPGDDCNFQVTAHSQWNSRHDFLFIDEVFVSYGQPGHRHPGTYRQTAAITCDDFTIVNHSEVTDDNPSSMTVNKNNDTFNVASDICDFSVDVTFDSDDCTDATVVLSLGDEYSQAVSGSSLEGICGLCNGDKTYETCFTHDDVTEENNKYFAISDSCRDDTPMVADAAECLVDGDPMIQTYSGARLLILNDQKTLLSGWDSDPEDPCKFKVRAITNDFRGIVFVNQVELSFGVDPEDTHEFDLRVQIRCNSVTVMGQQYYGQMVDLPKTFTSSDGLTSVKVTMTSGTTHVTSSTCPYALHVTFDPVDCSASMTRINAGERFLPSDGAAGMEGICGSGSDDVTDAHRLCFTHEEVSERPDHFRLISESCQDGAFQGTRQDAQGA